MSQTVANSFRFSTAATSGSPLDAIRALNDRGVVFRLDPLPGRAVYADIRVHSRPPLRIMEAVLAGVRHGVDRESNGNPDELMLATALSGSSLLRQRGREVALAGGGAALLRRGEGAFTLSHADRVRFLGLRLDAAAIAPLVGDVGAALMRPIQADSSALALLTTYVRSAARHRVLAAADAYETVVRHVHDLVALIAGATGEAAAVASGRGLRAARLRAIRTSALARLDDPALTAQTLARRHGISARYVHQLFEPTGSTFSQFVLAERLARAHRMLLDPRFDASTIGAVAFAVGFGDLSYFNRTFRRRYGCSPRELRASSLG